MSAIERDVLWERLLLVAYAYGTSTGIGAVAQGDHGHSESDLRYVARRYFTRNATHPVYQALLELGRAQRTIFVLLGDGEANRLRAHAFYSTRLHSRCNAGGFSA